MLWPVGTFRDARLLSVEIAFKEPGEEFRGGFFHDRCGLRRLREEKLRQKRRLRRSHPEHEDHDQQGHIATRLGTPPSGGDPRYEVEVDIDAVPVAPPPALTGHEDAR